MKRGNDEEKIMQPMFPRLHVNDAEKGGPRAPPRNKMALYEQLSTLSQRFRHGVFPSNPVNTTVHSAPSASSSQLVGNERGMFFSYQLPPRHLPEEPYNQQSDLSTPMVQVEWKKKFEEDDLRAPIFNNTRTSKDSGNYIDDMDREKPSSPDPANSNHSTKFRKTKQTSTIGHSMRQEGQSRKEVNEKEFVAGQDQLDEAASRSSSIDKKVGPCKQTDASLCFEPRDDHANVIDRSKSGQRPLLCAEPQFSSGVYSNGASTELSVAMDKENSSTLERDCPSEHNMVHDVREVMDSCEDRLCRSLQKGNMDRADSVHEISVVKSISEQGISPDDVVVAIDQKHFWKARRAIVNQQRIFAVQVFELHRLIKVQRMIAGLPHLSAEDASYLSKPVKASPAKKLLFDYIPKALADVPKNKGDTDKPDHTMEFSIENMVSSSVQSGVPPSDSGRPVSKNPPHKQQWLIPLVSPSEGLVYKPYPGPEFFYGPPGSTPVSPVPHQYQLPSFPPRSYFPPYCAMVNPVFSGSTSDKLSDEEANFSSQHQNWFNIPSQTSESRPDVPRLTACKDGELQGSTASSLSGRLRDSREDSAVERRNACPLFSASRAIEIHDSDPRPARAIKVLPHNARSATESAARIFRIIQEERKRQDSI